MVELREVATIERDGVVPGMIDPSTHYIGLEHIERGGRILSRETAATAAIKSTKFRFTPEHVLFGKLRPNLGKVARPTYSGVCSTDILPILPSARLDRGFLFHYLSQPKIITYAASQATGANLPRLSPAALAKFELPVPSVDEQRRIAKILDLADALRAKKRRILDHLDDLVRSTFLAMFGHFDGSFVTVEQISSPERGSIRTGPFGSQLLHSEFVDEGVAVLGLDNVVGNAFTWGERRYITRHKYEELRRYTVRPGDVLISIMGTCGRCVVVPPDVGAAINTKHICAITLDPDIAVPEYVRAAFLWHPRSRQHLARRTKGSIMDGLNMGIIKEMPLPLPDLDAQRQYVSRSQEVDEVLGSCSKSMSVMDELFASLQFRAFRGEL